MGKQQSSDAPMTTTASAAFVVWVAEAKQLRTAAVVSIADFFAHLARGEEQEAMWRGAGYATFSEVLDREDICRGSRFAAFKAEVARFGLDAVRAIGVDQAKEVLKIPVGAISRVTGTDATEAVMSVLRERAVQNAAPVSVQQTNAIIRQHVDVPRKARPAPGSPEERILALEEENAALRKQVRRLEADLARASGGAVKKSRGSLAAGKSAAI